MTESTPLNILIENQCAKLSSRAIGHLSYHCATDDQGKAFIRIFANSEKGAFSNEWLALDSILAIMPTNQVPFRSTLFVPLFTKKSANNAPFMAAILRHLGLLLTVDGFPSYSKRGSDMALRHQLKTLADKD
jgi:hypothetical protein